MDDVAAPPSPPRLNGTRDEFARDMTASVQAWRTAWWLPVLTLLLGPLMPDSTLALPGGPAAPVLVIIFVVGAIFGIGWFATTRLVYAFAFAGEPMSFGAAVRATGRWVLPFLGLGLLVYVPQAVAWFALDQVLPSAIALAILIGVADALLIFVVPARVFEDDGAVAAVRSGFQLLARQGSRAGWYMGTGAVCGALFPLSAELAWPARYPVLFAVTLVFLALRGATTAAYLRLHPELTRITTRAW